MNSNRLWNWRARNPPSFKRNMWRQGTCPGRAPDTVKATWERFPSRLSGCSSTRLHGLLPTTHPSNGAERVPHLLTAAAGQPGFEQVQAAHRPPGVGAADAHGPPVCWAFRDAPGGGRKVCACLAPRGLRRHLLSSPTVWDVCTPLPSKRGRPDTRLLPRVLRASGYLGLDGRGL